MYTNIYTYKKKKNYNTPNLLSQAMQTGLIYSISVHEGNKLLTHKSIKRFFNMLDFVKSPFF